MCARLAQSLNHLKDRVCVVGGFEGAVWFDVLEELHISVKLGKLLAVRYLVVDGFSFFIENISNAGVERKEVTGESSYLDDSQSRLICKGPHECLLEAFGVENADIRPGTVERHIITQLGKAGSTGCLPTDFGDMTGTKCGKFHTVADKLALFGFLTKRIATPLNGHSRAHVRNTILHLKRFAASYDPSSDHMSLSISDTKKERIFACVYTIIKDKVKVDDIACRDFAKYIGITVRQGQVLRNLLYTEARSSKPPKLIAYEGICVPAYKRSRDTIELRLDRKETIAWMFKLNPEVASIASWSISRSIFNCLQNAATFDRVAMCIREGNGVTSTDVRHATGLPFKRSYKVFIDFMESFKYPVSKIQHNTNHRLLLLPKALPKAPPVPRASSAIPNICAPSPSAESKEMDWPVSSTIGRPIHTEEDLISTGQGDLSLKDPTRDGDLLLSEAVTNDRSLLISNIYMERANAALRHLQVHKVADLAELSDVIKSQQIVEFSRNTKIDHKTIKRVIKRLLDDDRIVSVETQSIPSQSTIVENKRNFWGLPVKSTDKAAEGPLVYLLASTPSEDRDELAKQYMASRQPKSRKRPVKSAKGAVEEMGGTGELDNVAEKGPAKKRTRTKKKKEEEVEEEMDKKRRSNDAPELIIRWGPSGDGNEEKTGDEEKTDASEDRDGKLTGSGKGVKRARGKGLKRERIPKAYPDEFGINLKLLDLNKDKEKSTKVILSLVDHHPPGLCLSCITLHDQLVVILSPKGKGKASTGAGIVKENFVLPAPLLLSVVDQLPFKFFLDNSNIYTEEDRAALTDTPVYRDLITEALRDDMKAVDFIEKEKHVGLSIFAAAFDKTETRHKIADELCFMIAVGVISLFNSPNVLEAVDELLRNNLATAVDNNLPTVPSLPLPSPGGKTSLYDCDRPLMRKFALVCSILRRQAQAPASDVQAQAQVADFYELFLDEGHLELLVYPAGSSKPLFESDVYAHWISNVLPCLNFGAVTAIAKKTVPGVKGALQWQSIMVKYVQSRKADAGVEKCEDLLSAWADIPPLPAQYLNRICTQKEKEKESKTLKPGEKRGTKPKKVVAGAQVVASEVEEEDEPSDDSEGERELDNREYVAPPKTAPILADDDWTIAQDAALIEDFVVSFIYKKYYQPKFLKSSKGKGAKKTKSLSGTQLLLDSKIHPTSSCFDVDYTDVDFTMLTIKQIHNHCSGAPCRKSSINRIHLLIQTRAISSLRKAISFIFCYNSVETRKDFTNLVNTVLGVEHEHAHLPGEEKRRADALAARKLRRSLLQLYGDPDVESRMDCFRRLMEGGVRPKTLLNVHRELYSCNIIKRQTKKCGRDECAKLQICPHVGEFDLHDGFTDSLNELGLAPFYMDVLSSYAPIDLLDVLPKPEFFPTKKFFDMTLQSRISPHNGVSIIESLSIVHLYSVAMKGVESKIRICLDKYQKPTDNNNRADTWVEVDGVMEKELPLHENHDEGQAGIDAHSPAVEESTNEDVKEKLINRVNEGNFCKAFNRITVQLTTKKVYIEEEENDLSLQGSLSGAVATSNSASESEEQDNNCWNNMNGGVNRAIFQLLTSKVLTLLADKPGLTLKKIHCGLQITDQQETGRLLDLLVLHRMVVVQKMPKNATAVVEDLFEQVALDMAMVFGNEASPMLSEEDEDNEQFYFVA